MSGTAILPSSFLYDDCLQKHSAFGSFSSRHLAKVQEEEEQEEKEEEDERGSHAFLSPGSRTLEFGHHCSIPSPLSSSATEGPSSLSGWDLLWKDKHHDFVRINGSYTTCWIREAFTTMPQALEEAREEEEETVVLEIEKNCRNSRMIKGIHNRSHKQKVSIQEKVQQDTGWPRTLVASLKACAEQKDLLKGNRLHAEIVGMGLLETNIFIGNALVNMYAKCGSLAKAQAVFDRLPYRDVVSWSALIAGYVQEGHGELALKCFEQMQLEGLCPNSVTFICVLKACGSIRAADKGKEIHDEIVRERLLDKDIVVGTALVDMYSKCGLLANAQEVFDKLPFHDVVSWSALIAGYTQNGLAEEAVKCFEQMQYEGLSPNAFTYTCILKACGSIGAADKGKEIHKEIVQRGSLEKNMVVGTALVDMYAKCGLLAKAQEVFDKLPVRDVVSWSALMTGYALLGKAENVFRSFDKMIGEGIKPDVTTFTIVLNACNHTGLLDKGQMYFEIVRTCYGVIPTLKHHTCMVDLFARAGHLEKAVGMIKEMPFSADFALWLIVLNACQKWGNVKLGRVAFEHAVQLDEKEPASYVFMSNIYADAGMHEEADKIEAMRVQKQAWMKPGQSWWTDARGTVHSFTVGSYKHSEIKIFHARLKYLGHKVSQGGCFPGLHQVPESSSSVPKNSVLCGHTEKLAIAFALINTPNGTPVHVVKNMQICSDCHSAISLISKRENRIIFVKDTSRFHVFDNGKCVCGDFWC